MTRRLAASAVVGALACAGMVAVPAAQAAAGRTPIPGTRPSWATSARQVSAMVSGTVNARVYLAGRNPGGLARFASAVSRPGSAEFRHYLTPAQVRQRFGPTAAQRSAVSRWLTGAGLKITSSTGHYIAVSGSVTAAQQAFAVRFGDFRDPQGKMARAPEQAASVPASVGPAVLTITGLDTATYLMHPRDTLPPPSPAFYVAPPCSSYYGQQIATNEPPAYGKSAPWVLCGYQPKQLRGAYGAALTGLTGKGVTVAVVDAYASSTMLSDANQYATTVGDKPFAPGQYTEVLPSSYDQTDACGAPSWYGEESLDVEAVHGMAPAAKVVYVGASDCSDPSLLGALTTIVDNHLADVVSNSWGETEDQTNAASMAAYNQIFQQGAAEGIGFNFSSGDCGYEDPANSCGAGRDGSDRIQVDFPTSSPYVTSVGGTSLAVGPRNNYEFETGWGTYVDQLDSTGTAWTPVPPGTYPANYTSGAGGGTSTVFAQPSYQAGVVPTSLSEALPGGSTSPTPMREVPDVAALADPSTGFAVGQTVQLADGSYGFHVSRIGGTSLAAPLVAGMMADAAQLLRSHTLGFANPVLYRLAGSPAYHDVIGSPSQVALVRNDFYNSSAGTGPTFTTLRNLGLDGGGAALLQATPGYDDVTGVGTPTALFYPLAALLTILPH